MKCLLANVKDTDLQTENGDISECTGNMRKLRVGTKTDRCLQMIHTHTKKKRWQELNLEDFLAVDKKTLGKMLFSGGWKSNLGRSSSMPI